MIDFTDKFLSVVSTPRTGSIWFSHLLFHYSMEVHGFKQLLSEPFNEFHYNLWYEPLVNRRGYKNQHSWAGDRLRQTYDVDDNGQLTKTHKTYETDPGPVNITEETTKRLKLISSQDKLVLHNHIEPLDKRVIAFIYSFPCVFVGRKDKWQQLLSYGVAYHTKVFARFSALAPQTIPRAKEIDFPLDVAERLLARIQVFERERSQQEFPTVWFEDMNFDEPAKTMQLLGIEWQPKVDLHTLKTMLPKKQTPGDKETYFKNINELRSLYNKYFGDKNV